MFFLCTDRGGGWKYHQAMQLLAKVAIIIVVQHYIFG